MDDRRYLQSLIREGEHLGQDFKYRVSDAVKLARSVSAFANTEGGRLLIGVRDDGRLCGVRSEEEIYMMHQAAYRYCRPQASIKFDTYHVEGRTIVVATVPRSERRPVFALEPPDGVPAVGQPTSSWRQRAYIRVADENIVASPVHLHIWREEQSPLGTSFTYGDNERRLMAAMQTDSWLPLNPIVKRSALPRPLAIALLARLVRYHLAACRLHGGQFEFALL